MGIDSSMLHVADLCGVPGVGLFGPSNAEHWGFRLARHRHVCGRDARMDTIAPEEVIQALEDICTTSGNAPAGSVPSAESSIITGSAA